MRDRSMHAGGFGSIVNCPFGLVHIKVEQYLPTGPILKRADRTVDLAYLVLAHSASLSAHAGAEADPAGSPLTHTIRRRAQGSVCDACTCQLCQSSRFRQRAKNTVSDSPCMCRDADHPRAGTLMDDEGLSGVLRMQADGSRPR